MFRWWMRVVGVLVVGREKIELLSKCREECE